MYIQWILSKRVISTDITRGALNRVWVWTGLKLTGLKTHIFLLLCVLLFKRSQLLLQTIPLLHGQQQCPTSAVDQHEWLLVPVLCTFTTAWSFFSALEILLANSPFSSSTSVLPSLTASCASDSCLWGSKEPHPMFLYLPLSATYQLPHTHRQYHSCAGSKIYRIAGNNGGN